MMKIEESKSMTEIREIRDKIYLEIKDMTPEDRREYFQNRAAMVEEKLEKKLPRVAKIEA